MPSGLKQVAEGIYKRGDTYYERIQIEGRDTARKIPVATLAEAKKYRAARILQHAQAREGILPGVESPYNKPKRQTVNVTMAQLSDDYLAKGCPDKMRHLKIGKQLGEEKRKVALLNTWPGWDPITDICGPVLLEYEEWRKKSEGNKIRNGRVIDQEITVLKNILRWGILCGKIPASVLAAIPSISFQTEKSTHSKDQACQSPDELHTFAQELLCSDTRSQASGFQMLFEAYTGVRTSEALACRWDAKYGEPGFIDGNHLHLSRRKGGVNPWAKIHPALAELLEAMKKWRSVRVFTGPDGTKIPYSQSPWFFPSPQNPMQPLDRRALVKALARITREKIAKKELPADTKRTSHGCRAFYVLVRRSEGEADAVIAAEIGDRTGAAIITQIYGPLPPNWAESKGGKITWLPKDRQTAWVPLLQKLRTENIVPLQSFVGSDKPTEIMANQA